MRKDIFESEEEMSEILKSVNPLTFENLMEFAKTSGLIKKSELDEARAMRDFYNNTKYGVEISYIGEDGEPCDKCVSIQAFNRLAAKYEEVVKGYQFAIK